MTKTLDVASTHALIAHHALGRMTACTSVVELSDAASEFLQAAATVSRCIARLGVEEGTSTPLARHPLAIELQRIALTNKAPALYVSRLARGSEAPPFRDGLSYTQVKVTLTPRPEDFFFESTDKKSAIELCAEYLDRVTALLDVSRRRLE
jgi:hypothetical protein